MGSTRLKRLKLTLAAGMALGNEGAPRIAQLGFAELGADEAKQVEEEGVYSL